MEQDTRPILQFFKAKLQGHKIEYLQYNNQLK